MKSFAKIATKVLRGQHWRVVRVGVVEFVIVAIRASVEVARVFFVLQSWNEFRLQNANKLMSFRILRPEVRRRLLPRAPVVGLRLKVQTHLVAQQTVPVQVTQIRMVFDFLRSRRAEPILGALLEERCDEILRQRVKRKVFFRRKLDGGVVDNMREQFCEKKKKLLTILARPSLP